MIALVLFGLCIYFAVGVVYGLFMMLQALGIGLLWWLAPSNAFKHLCNGPPPAPTVPPEQWLRSRGKMPPPIPPDAKHGKRVDENGIPYL